MKALDKRIFRDFKNNLGKYLSIFILLTATIAFGSAFLIVSDGIEATVDNDQQENRLEDGNFLLNEKYDFSNSKYEIEENFYINLENTYTLRIYNNRTNINKLSIHKGRLATSLNEIAIDRVFAKSNNIKLNDNINIDNRIFNVVGFISAPDYNSLFKNNNDLMMNTTDFGIGFVSNSTFNELENIYNVKYNYSYKGNTTNIKNYLIEENTKISNIITKDQNQSISFLTEDMGSDVPAMKALIYIVIVIIAFVFVILSNNNIEMDSKSIGTLKALGYKKNEIIFHYMKLPIVITIISAIIGNLLSYTVLLEPFKSLYYDTYSISPLEVNLNMEAFILTTVIPIIIMILVNYLMLRKRLSLRPLNFLRNDIRKNKTRKINLSSKLSFNTRFKLRVIIDNIGNFITLFFGIYLASLILLFAVGITPLIEHYEDSVNDTFQSEYQYVVNQPLELDEYNLTQYTMKTYYKIGKQDVDVSFIGLNNTDKYYKNLKLQDLDKGIVISDSLALKLDIKIGDKVKFKDVNYNKSYTYKVLDIYEYRASFAVFVKQEELNQLLNYPSNYFNSYLSDKKLDIDQKYIIKEISKEEVASVAKQMLRSFDELIDMVMVFAIVIYLVLMYVLTKVIIERSSLNISLMKVFGYNNKEVKKLYLNATTIAVITSLILVMPLEIFTFDFIMKYAMGKIEGYIEFFVPIMTIITVIGIGIITYLIINKLHVNKINKIPMSDALKDRE